MSGSRPAAIPNVNLLLQCCVRALLHCVLVVGLCGAALAQSPQTANDYFKRGNEYRNKGDYEKAITDYTEALRLDPQLAKAYANRAVAHFHLKEFEKAITDSTQAIRINPRYAEAYHNRGTAYFSSGNQNEALADINRAIKLNPRLAEAYFSRGMISNSRNDDGRAIADYTRAIKLDPKLAKAYYNRGTSYYRTKDYEHAISDYTRTISLTPKEFMAYWARGGVYADRKEYQRAIADLTKAISLAPNDTKIYSKRAEVYCAQGKKELATADENKIVELGGNVYDRCGAGDMSQPTTSSALDKPPRFSSVYTNLKTQCKTPAKAVDEGQHSSTFCRGIGNYRIHIFDSAMALHINAETLDRKTSISLAEQNLSYDRERRRIEWRLANGRPFAVILRVFKYSGQGEYPLQEKPIGEVLLVKGLAGFEHIDGEVDIKVTGNPNAKARDLADAGYERPARNPS
jgi:tetratricopeptide (TPR) repeat protein